MTLIKREGVPTPVLPREEVEVASLGGSVVVQGLGLSDRMAYLQANRAAGVPLQGETAADAERRSGTQGVPALLALTVLDAEDQPVFSRAQWEAHGASHAGECLMLFEKAWALCGFGLEAVEKN